MHVVNKRPLSVTLIGGLFLVTGVVALGYHATDFKLKGPLQSDLILACVVRLLAVIGAVFMLRAHNWARWLLVIWMAYHVALSAFHSASQVIVHSVLFGIIVYFLFWRPASDYFRGVKAGGELE